MQDNDIKKAIEVNSIIGVTSILVTLAGIVITIASVFV